ncbi:MAG: hypothetical protein GC134_03850 [Proteobacteria bacterium]|nr:hypothetical protein [Pseudomonadota bacterium]
MTNTKNLFSACLAAALSAGCATTDKVAVNTPKERLAEARQTVKEFGIWTLKDCQLHAKRADIEIFTDGRMTGNTLFFRMVAHEPLLTAPKLSLWGVGGFNLDLDGRDNTWSFKFPFGPADAAKMISDDVFVVVGYQIAESIRPLNAVFSARELPAALEYLSANCLDNSDS